MMVFVSGTPAPDQIRLCAEVDRLKAIVATIGM